MRRVLYILALIVCLSRTGRADPPFQRVANTTLAMPSTPPSYGYTLTNAFGTLNFNDPVCITSPPGETNRLFVVERGGTIAVITNLASPTRSVFLNISSEMINLEECGMLCLTFHPGYATNGYFYVYYTGNDTTAAGSGQHDILSRFQVTSTNANVADPTSEVKIIRQYDRGQYHNGGDLHFGTDGYLYISIGDENCCNDPFGNSQVIDKNFFSGMFRIDVDKRPGNLTPNPNAAITTNYLVPADNPFIGINTFNGTNINPASLRTEFWAMGMRNPWRFSFDPPTGLLYLGDVGQDAQEEVDIVTKGGNYGWAYREGSIAGPKPNPPTSSAYNPISPIISYAHGSATNQGNAVIGGLVYRGTQLSQLVGSYVFGDNVDGNIWTLQYNGTNATNWQRILGGAVGISTFGADPRNGDILVALRGVEGSGSSVTTQPLQRLVYSSTVTGAPLPPTLNDTGAFSNLTTLAPNPGIVPYNVNVPFWSDNAVKSRWFSIPNTNLTIGYNPTNNWTFPPGTVWIKHFDLQTNSSPPMSTRVETRLLVRNSNGIYGVTYRWAGGTNATLVPEGGMDDTFVINNGGVLTTQAWHYPARSECLACHTPVAGYALGLNAPQMDLNQTYSTNTLNQLQVLSDVGYFSSPVTNLPAVTPLATATNTSMSLEYRARSYLAADCVQCHQPGGGGFGLWDARFSTPLAQAGLINGPLINNFGDSNNYVIALGSLSNSVLLTRVANLGTYHMPPLATSVINNSAVQLLSAWITSSNSTAQLVVSPPSLGFGTVAVGATVQASFAITNLGSIAITNGTATVNPPFAIVSGSQFNLAGFTSSTVVVSFSPTSSGSFSNNVIFTSNGGNSTNAVTGSGTPPAQLSVSPASFSFGTVAVSNTVQTTFAITNLGGTAITNGTAVVGPPFAIISGNPFNLAGFAGANVVVSCTPTDTDHYSNNVIFTSNGGNSTNAVTGSGTPPAQLAVSPTGVNFGTVAVGNTVQATFTITNLGGIAITNGTAIVGGSFSIVSGSPFNLVGFSSSNVLISFTPTNSGNFSNNVIFACNGGNSTNAVTGAGTPPAQLSVSPASFNFGIVAVSNTVHTTFVITNLGGIAITNGTAVVGPPFAIVSGSPFTLPGFTSSNVVVSCTPTDTDSYSNNVTFTSNGGNSTNAVTGTGALRPTASFSATPRTGTWPLLVAFTNNSSGTITNSFWSFGDGANTNTLNSSVTHDYAAAGTNTVTLTVSGPVGTNTQTLSGYIVVTDPPPVTLNISLSGNQVQLAWPQGTLQSAAQATGAYTNLTNGSPYLVIPSNAAQFYRVRVR